MSILFYDDSPVFGGHEVMSLLGIEAVLETTDMPVRLMAAVSNVKLMERGKELAAKYPHFTLEPLHERSCKLEALRNRLLRSRVRALSSRLAILGPELIIAIQGNIEHSSLVLLAAAEIGVHCASYIPVPHGNEEMGAKLGGIRDLFSAYLFQRPDDFITITDEMARILRSQGVVASIHIVYNGVDIVRFQPADRAACRAELDLPQEPILLGMVGRIEFRQKQQHLLVDAIHSSPELKSCCHLVFAGEGPDKEKLRAKAASRKVNAMFLPWCDPAKLYPALNALLLPSRYEGLPLVMLEALACGIPVFGSDRDGMKDVLPDAWRFPPTETAGLRIVLDHWIADGMPPPDAKLVARVRNSMSLEAFSKAFSATVLKLVRA